MSDIIYCNKCTIKTTHPNLKFNDENTCEICCNSGLKKDWKKYATNYKTAMLYYNEYKDSKGNENDVYDCMIMLSGGKDSIYMLDKIITEHGKKVLAYTYNLPTENKNSVKNIKKAVKKLNVDHINFTADTKYKKLIGHFYRGFNIDNIDNYEVFGDDIPYMICLVCTSYITISAYIMAYKLNIPYVLYCADPIQIVNVNPDIKNYVNMLTKAVGKSFLDELFDNQIDILTDENNFNLPKIIYPFFGVSDYDAEEIVSELTQKGLYDLDPSQLSTICSLYGLNNYFSYKNFNCSIYAKLDARFVRDGKISRVEIINTDKAFKHVMTKVIPKSTLTDEDDSMIQKLADQLSIIAVKENLIKNGKINSKKSVDVNSEKFKFNSTQIYNILKNTKKIAATFDITVS